MLAYKKTNFILIFIVLCFPQYDFNSYASDANHKLPVSLPPEKQLLPIKGIIHTPPGTDPSSITVEVAAFAGLHVQDKRVFTSPSTSGAFSFEELFPRNSSLFLMFWDKNGVLNTRIMPVYVGEDDQKILQVTLDRADVTQTVANSFSVNHDFTSAGFCGKIVGIQKEVLNGSEIFLEGSSSGVEKGHYFSDKGYPSVRQETLSENGSFCFFNLISQNKSDFYKLHLKTVDRQSKTFPLFLPPYTFPTNIEFDAKSSLFKKVSFPKNINNTDKIFLYTSSDYSEIPFKKDNLIFFPVSSEFTYVNFRHLDFESLKFFALFAKNELLKNLDPNPYDQIKYGATYISKSKPLAINFLNLKELPVKLLSYLNQESSSNFGSIFLDFDFRDFSFSKENISIKLKDLSGNTFSQFYPLLSDINQIKGFFFQVPPGFYQLFVSNKSSQSDCSLCIDDNGKSNVIWMSIVQSIQGKINVLSHFQESKIRTNNEKVIVYKPDSNSQPQSQSLLDVLPINDNLAKQKEIPNLENIMNALRVKDNSIYYKYPTEKFCSMSELAENSEKSFSINSFFIHVGNVNLIPGNNY